MWCIDWSNHDGGNCKAREEKCDDDPQCAESGKQLDALYQRAIPLAVRLINEYVAGLDTDAPLDAAYQHTFGEN